MTRSFYKRLAPLCVLVVTVGSFLPVGAKRQLGTHVDSVQDPYHNSVPIWHRVVHYLSFGITAAVLILSAQNKTQRTISLLTAISLSLMIEYTQHLIGHFDIEWWDVRDDVISELAVYSALALEPIRRFFVRE
jgi:hypothetical protein